MRSVLEGSTAADVCTVPFAHLVVENCLPIALYEELARTYPSDEQILGLNTVRQRAPVRSNKRYNASAHQVLGRRCLTPAWEAFVQYHSSREFFCEVVDVFGPAIRAQYPALEQRLGGALHSLSTGVRFDSESDHGTISLDCQVAINTPVTKAGSVRKVHADAPEELFAMLLYFRRGDDDSVGGDLEIWRWKDGHEPAFLGKQASEADAEHVSTIPYRANTLFAFLNSERALHAVSARQPTPHSRRLVNIIGEVYHPLPNGLFVKRQKPFGKLRQKLAAFMDRRE
jgi:hypothetical protein